MILHRINDLRKQYRRYSELIEKLQDSNDPQMAGEMKYYSERLAKVGEELGWLLAQQQDQKQRDSGS